MNGRRVVAGLVVAVLLVGGVAYSTAKGSEKSSTISLLERLSRGGGLSKVVRFSLFATR